MLLLCDSDSFSKKGTTVTIYDPKTETEIKGFHLERIGSLFCADGKLQAISQESFEYGNKEKTKYALVTLNNDGTVQERKPFGTTNFSSGVGYLNQRLLRHPSGILFFQGYGKVPADDYMDTTLEVFSPNGEYVCSTHIPFYMQTACFDAEGNLAALATVSDEKRRMRILGVKYAVHYDPAILEAKKAEEPQPKATWVERIKSLMR